MIIPGNIPNDLPYKLKDDCINKYASGYSLDLYCDHANPNHLHSEFPHQFVSEFKRYCFGDARHIGWIIRIDGTATCPKCCKTLKLGKFKAKRAR